MSSTVIDKTAEEILEYQGENDDLQLDYDDADAILGDDPEPSTVVSSKKVYRLMQIFVALLPGGEKLVPAHYPGW